MFQPEDVKSYICNTFLECFEVIIHNILYSRKLYPSGIFKLMKKHGVPVYISQYPDVNSYIKECLNAIEALLKVEKCKQINLCFHNKHYDLVEKMVFHLPNSNIKEKLESLQLDPFLNEINQSLRTLLLKLSEFDSIFRPLPEGSTFMITIETTEHAMDSLNDKSNLQNFPWIQADQKSVDKKIIPIHNMYIPINLEIFIEETIADKS